MDIRKESDMLYNINCLVFYNLEGACLLRGTSWNFKLKPVQFSSLRIWSKLPSRITTKNQHGSVFEQSFFHIHEDRPY